MANVTGSDIYSMYGVNAATKTTKTTTASTNKVEDTFMELLLAELRNQNPMEPMDSSQMVTQMAQMNSLQELQKITASLKGVNQSNQFLTASSLIGKQITYISSDSIKQGMVSAFTINNNVISLLVNDLAISLDEVIAVAGKEGV
jgi:flagellar basal-body rod modification protein FlgD